MMRKQIYTRIKALDEAITRKRTERDMPVDPLSRSLMEFSAELSGLDSLGKSALMAELEPGGTFGGDEWGGFEFIGPGEILQQHLGG